MKMLPLLMCLIFVSCKSTNPYEEKDLLKTLINLHKSGDLSVLTKTFGHPSRIEKTDEPQIVRHIYEGNAEVPGTFESFVDLKKNEVISSSMMFWKSDDDYQLLKKNFGNHQWIEKYVPTSPHPLREIYEVQIPELGMSFEYDKLAPKIMWIVFKKPRSI